jgi:hypothetical protein
MRRLLEGQVADLQLEERRSRIEAIKVGHWRHKTQIIEKIVAKTGRGGSEAKRKEVSLYLGP